MTDEYIRKQDAIDDLHTQLMYRMGTDDMKRRLDDWVKTLPSADVVQVETLQAKISELKYQMDCRTPNIDYYTGYVSALSTVEGILAAMGEE